MKYEIVVVGTYDTNCYLVYCEDTRESVIIDPGAEPEKIFGVTAGLDLKPVLVLNTHGHADHIGANLDMIQKYKIPLAIHPADEPLLQADETTYLGRKSPAPDRFLEDGESISFGRASLRVLHTPGHSPGGVSLAGDGILFSGDTLFNDGVGRTDLPGGSWKDLVNSIKDKILTLDGETIVLPGHGPWTTVAQEARSNPFLS
jgi:glyoxylase-like metal-dependent hydrolase (beta-lactamase superfamily II)